MQETTPGHEHSHFAAMASVAPIRVVPLGAGQDVGRSCVLVTLGGKTVMFDCGMHMGYNDERRFPDFGRVKLFTV